MSLTCYHDASRASLASFLAATTFLGFVDFGFEVQAQGRCNGCDTTLAIVVDVARGHVARGEIDLSRGASADEMARRTERARERTAELSAPKSDPREEPGPARPCSSMRNG